MDVKALFRFSYGLYVVGVKTPGGFGGCVVDAVAQVASGTPPNIILSSMKANYTNERIKAEKEFTLSVLSENSEPFVVANFGFQSARTEDKWPNVPHNFKDGLPVLKEAAAWARCRVTEVTELSTHTLFLCEVTDAWDGAAEAQPLIYGNYQKTMKNAALEAFNAFKASGKAHQAVSGPRCSICNYTYAAETPFDKLPPDWKCPICGAGKEKFN